MKRMGSGRRVFPSKHTFFFLLTSVAWKVIVKEPNPHKFASEAPRKISDFKIVYLQVLFLRPIGFHFKHLGVITNEA